MARRRSRRSRVESFMNRVVIWFIVLIVFLMLVLYVFESAPVLGLFLFLILPVITIAGITGFRWRAHTANKRKALEEAKQRIETAQHIGSLLTGSGPDFDLPSLMFCRRTATPYIV